MKRKVFLFFVLLVMALSIRAQSYYYDVWFDGNRSTMTHGTFADGENELTLDLSSVPWPGLHFLNIVPYSEAGDVGVWKCIPFIMPEGWPNSTETASVEYWVTGYDANPKHIPFNEDALALDIDVSGMSCGLHFLNYRVFSQSGYPGPWKIMPFYLSNGTFGKEEMQYEYWIDSEEPKKTGIGIMPGTLDVQIETADLADGEHIFNFKACNLLGAYGEVFTTTFNVRDGKLALIPGDINGNGTLDAYDVHELVTLILLGSEADFVNDVHHDGILSLTDVTKLVNLILGNE